MRECDACDADDVERAVECARAHYFITSATEWVLTRHVLTRTPRQCEHRFRAAALSATTVSVTIR